MRAALLPIWPALTETFNVTPWNFQDLSPAELNSYIEALRDRAEEAKRQKSQRARSAARPSRRRR